MKAPFVYKDRVKDSSTSTGTGNLTLSGSAPSGFQSFNTAFGVDIYFTALIGSASGSEWEVSICHLSASTTLVRDQCLRSSNSDAFVSLSAGTKDVICVLSADAINNNPSIGLAMAMLNGAHLANF